MSDADSLSALKSIAASGAVVDRAKLVAFVQSQPALAGHSIDLKMTTDGLAAGASSGTLLFTIESPTADPRQCGEFVLRFDLGDGSFFSQTSLTSQFNIMKALGARGVAVPEAVWLDLDGRIVPDASSLIMRRVDARAPSIRYLLEGMYAQATPDLRTRMLHALMAVAVDVHRQDLAALDLPGLETRGGAGQHFLDREINWVLAELHARFPEVEEGERAELHTEMRRVLEGAADFLRAHAPRHREPVLAHGDLTFANTMFREDGTVAALLDWELSHAGLPEADIAYFCFAMRSIATFGSLVDPLPSEEEVSAAYVAAGGVVRDWDYARTFAAFRVATWGAIGMRRMPREHWPAEAAMWRTQSGILREAMSRCA